MNVLLIGSGGREHALSWKLLQSPELSELHAIPGSDAMADDGAECHADDNVNDHQAMIGFCKTHDIDLAVIGPEAPLVDGLSDSLRDSGFAVFGPSKAAAQLEGSKSFMKDLCRKYDIPTAQYERFTNAAAAKAYLEENGLPIVIKADGLAAGKGVVIAQTKAQAEATIDDMLEHNKFGKSGAEIVIEEFLDGEELSVFALCDGKDAIFFGSAQDHKAAYDGDQGPNTGGMGAYSPAHMMNEEMQNEVMTRIIDPTLSAMKKEGVPFHGVLFAGLMVTPRANGTHHIKLLEYNVRFGDPECQTLVMRLQSDLLLLMKACAEGNLLRHSQENPVNWDDRVALCVVMAASGYPGDYEKGSAILIPKGADMGHTEKIFHAGTKKDDAPSIDHDLWRSTGGRVLGCTALGKSFADAQNNAYDLVAQIEWAEGFCRTDIGHKAVNA